MKKSIICNEPSCELFGSGVTKGCKDCKERLYRPEDVTLPYAQNDAKVNKITETKKYKCKSKNCSQCDFSPGDFNCRVHADEIISPNETEITKDEGTKYDTGKARLGEMIVDFCKPLFLVCKVWEFGANKYSKSNWKKVSNGKDRYTNAMMRHIALEDTEIFDTETGLPHALHVAWNALARLYFIINEDAANDVDKSTIR